MNLSPLIHPEVFLSDTLVIECGPARNKGDLNWGLCSLASHLPCSVFLHLGLSAGVGVSNGDWKQDMSNSY